MPLHDLYASAHWMQLAGSADQGCPGPHLPSLSAKLVGAGGDNISKQSTSLRQREPPIARRHLKPSVVISTRCLEFNSTLNPNSSFSPLKRPKVTASLIFQP